MFQQCLCFAHNICQTYRTLPGPMTLDVLGTIVEGWVQSELQLAVAAGASTPASAAVE